MADASSLIVLARLGGLGLLGRTFGIVALTRDVEAEVVVAGKAKGYRDAAVVERAIGRSALAVIDPTAKERRQAKRLGERAASLGGVDCTTIVCARERGLVLLIEDQRARRVALAEGVRCISLAVLPFYGYVGGQLGLRAAKKWLTRIGGAMRSDPVVLDALETALNEIARLRGDAKE